MAGVGISTGGPRVGAGRGGPPGCPIRPVTVLLVLATNRDIAMGLPSVPLRLSRHSGIDAFTFFIDGFPKPLHPLLAVLDAVDLNKGVAMCEPQHSVTSKFLTVCTPGLVAVGCDAGGQHLQSDVECKAAKMVNAIHTWLALNSAIIPRNVLKAECFGDLFERLPEKMPWVGGDSITDLRVPLLVVVCRP